MLLSFRGSSLIPETEPTKRRGATSKKWHSKVRSGCLRCKIRKVKCDEERPECLRCRKGGFKCGYDVPTPKVFSINDGLRWDKPGDKKFYDFFINEGSALLATFQPSTTQFWRRLTPQLSKGNPAVQYGMTALGALQAPLQKEPSAAVVETMRPKLSSTALTYLVKAMNSLTSADPTSVSPEVSLTCCLLFTAIAIWTEKTGAPVLHIDAGLRILRDYRKQVDKDPLLRSTALEEEFVRPFDILVANACAFSDDYPTPTSGILPNYALDIELDSSIYLLNYPDAIDSISTILKCIFRLNEGCTATGINEKVASALESFPISLDDLNERDKKLSMDRGRPENVNADAATHASIHHRTAYIMFHARKAGNEMDFDLFHNDFKYIVNESRTYLARTQTQNMGQPGNLMTQLGAIPPLFFTATKCRNSVLRWRALELLHGVLWAERGWTSCIATTLAKFVIETEEAGLNMTQPQTVPIENRIDLKHVAHSSGDCITSLRFRYFLDNEATPERTAILPFQPHRSVENDGVTFPMSRKVLRACGYTGIFFFTPRISCHCPGSMRRSLSVASDASIVYP